MVSEASLNAAVAQLIYETRTKAGLTQQQLADRVGTKQSVITRLEDKVSGHLFVVGFEFCAIATTGVAQDSFGCSFNVNQ